MINQPIGGFDILRQNIVSAAVKDLRKIAPEYVKAFETSLQLTQFEHAVQHVRTIKVGQGFNKWREIMTRLLDVELAIHQLHNSLTLLKQPAPAPLALGEWVVYQRDAWAIWAQGLLERFDKLATRVVRELVQPSNSNFKAVESQIRGQIRDLKKKVKKVRDPIAHGGGPIEVLKDEGLLEPLLLIGGKVDMKDVLDRMAKYQKKWHKVFSDTSVVLIANIQKLSETLNQEVTWPE